MLDFEALIQKEFETLAPFAMKSGDSKGRKIEEPPAGFRTHFQRDRDRIIHSAAFRRLEYKTQVFVNHEGDHYRTRLTHTIEVSQIGRSIARALGLNEDLTEAVILAHDLGHTPFGHAGERIMDELMKDFGGFEHNTQSLRIVDKLEMRYPHFRGLNLSYEVREGIAKHSTPYDQAQPMPEFNPKVAPPLEVQIADLADEIAYNNHDVDDGLKSRLLTWGGMDEVALFQEAKGRAMKMHKDCPLHELKHVIISQMISALCNDVINFSRQQIEKHKIDSMDAVRNSTERIINFSPEMLAKKNELKDYLMKNMYMHWRVIRMEEKAKRMLSDLFKAYTERQGQIPPEFIEKSDPQTSRERVICDYMAGMTDRFALDEHKKLFDPFEKV